MTWSPSILGILLILGASPGVAEQASKPPAPSPRVGVDPAARAIVREGIAIRSAGSPVFGTDVLLSDLAIPSHEPAIASRADGTLFAAVVATPPAIDVYQSDDDGYTWTLWFRATAADAVSHPAIIVGEGNVNRLVLAYVEGSETPSARLVVLTRDLDNPADISLAELDASPYASLASPRLCVDSPEYAFWYPYIVWERPVVGRGAGQQVRFSRSTDYGDTFETPQSLGTGGGPTEPDVDFGASRLFVALATGTSGSRDIQVRQSTDFGATWDPAVDVATAVQDEFEPSVVASNGGDAVVVAFSKTYGAQSDIEAAISTNGGSTWFPNYLPWNSDDERTADLDVSASGGRIHAAFRRDDEIVYTYCAVATPGAWSTERVLTDLSTATAGYAPAICRNASRPQEAIVAWTAPAPDGSRVYVGAAYPLGKYLIVAGSDPLATAVESFAEWKASIGFDVEIVTRAQVFAASGSGDDAERFWSYLRDRRTELRYVLLVGDVDTIPMRPLFPSGNPAYPPTDPRHDNGLPYGSDYYYAKVDVTSWDLDLDGRWGEFVDDALDPEPDLLVGRIPFSDVTNATAACASAVAFESSEPAGKRAALLAHGFLNYRGKASDQITDAAYAGEHTRNNDLLPTGWSALRLYERNGVGPSGFASEDSLTRMDYRSYVGAFGLVSAMAHGNPWGLSGIRWVSDVNGNGFADLREEWIYNEFVRAGDIAASPATGLVLLTGCSTGVLWGDDRGCWDDPLGSGWLSGTTLDGTMLKEYLRHGAAAVVASSAGSDYGYAWTSPAGNGGQSLAVSISSHLVSGRLRAGDAFHRAMFDYVNTHGYQRGIRVFNFYGDPALSFETVDVPAATREAAARYVAARPRLESAEREARDAVACALLENPDQWSPLPDLAGATTISSLMVHSGGKLFAAGMISADEDRNAGVVYRWEDAISVIPTPIPLPAAWSIRDLAEAASGALIACGLAEDGGYEGRIYRSEDEGGTWITSLDLPGGILTNLIVGESGVIYAASAPEAGVWRSDDDGVSFGLVSTIGGESRVGALLQVGDRLLAALEVPGEVAAIMYSDDEGISWTQAAGLGSVVAAHDLVAIGGIVYAGVAETGDAGWVYASADAGTSWSRTTEFTDPSNIRAVTSLGVGIDGRLIAGASSGWGPAGSAVYVADASLTSWEPLGGGLELATDVTAIMPIPPPLIGRGTPAVLVATGSIYGDIYVAGYDALLDSPPPISPPAVLTLAPPAPNPFTHHTALAIALPSAGPVRVIVVSSDGRRVRTLLNHGAHEAGRLEVSWDGTDDVGHPVSSGVYFTRVETPSGSRTQKVLLVR